ncbi:MAG TPA: hypothetical protein VMZ71_05240 [Gemmataceae bacterium]|nr:hypothetical protein [Gemmataceae bacterium]
MKFRRKPTVVSAVQYKGPPFVGPGASRPLCAGLVWIRREENGKTVYRPHTVTTAGRYSPVWPHDWVVKDPAGDGYYAVEPATFPQLYEAA